jgi:flagellar biosynthesis anti-sigma factor FlgM
MKVSEEQARKVLEAIREKHREKKETGHEVREAQPLYRGVIAEAPAGSPSSERRDVSSKHGGEAHPDADLIAEVKALILNMPEVREEVVAELRDRIERGEYHVSASDIAEAMVRRAIADSISD